MYRIKEERWLEESHLTPYALGFGYHIYHVLPEMPALCQSLPLLREPQLPQDSTEPDCCIGWAHPCSLFQPDAGWNPIWIIVVSKSLDGFLHFYALYLGSNVCFCMCVSDHASPSRSPALSPVPAILSPS